MQPDVSSHASVPCIITITQWPMVLLCMKISLQKPLSNKSFLCFDIFSLPNYSRNNILSHFERHQHNSMSDECFFYFIIDWVYCLLISRNNHNKKLVLKSKIVLIMNLSALNCCQLQSYLEWFSKFHCLLNYFNIVEYASIIL